MSLRPRDFLAIARMAARSCHDKKADDIVVFDVRRLSAFADFYVLASVGSSPHMQAVRDEVDRQIKEIFDLNPLHLDGAGSPQWSVLDYGGVVVHVMNQAARAFYGLERLWTGARSVQWNEDKPPKEKKPRVARSSTAGTKRRTRKNRG